MSGAPQPRDAARLAPDAVQMHAHLDHLFGDAGDGLIELAWNEAGTSEVRKAWHYANTPDDRAQLIAMACAAGVNAKSGQNVYVGAALRRPGMPKGKRASDGDFFALTALYADLDEEGAADGAWRACTARGCPPTCVVVTGTVPSKRAQFWWRLDAPITDPKISRGVVAAITAALGGDRAVVNPSRVMRLGASIAWPPDPPKPSKPGRVVEMTAVRLLHPQRRYSLAEMEAAFPPVACADSHGHVLRSTAQPQAPCLTTDALIARICAGNGGWHDDVLCLVAHWIGRRWSDGEILATAAQLTLDDYTVEQTTEEMLQMIEGARVKWDLPDQPHVLGQHGDLSTKPAAYFRAALAGELAKLRDGDPAHRLASLGRAAGALARFVDAAWDDLADEFTAKYKDPSGDAGDDDWPEPEPLIRPLGEPESYPLDALSPTLRDAVSEYCQYGQQPVPIAAAAALGAASLAAQGLVDVARDDGLHGPVSLYLLTVALSGERKTSADTRFRKATWKWQFDERARLAPDVAAGVAAKEIWTAEHDGIAAKIKRASGGGGSSKGPSLEALKAMLIDLDKTRPVPVLVPSLFLEDVTPEALALTLANGWPSTSLWLDEAGLFIGAHAMGDQSVLRTLALLNRLWDALQFDRRRATSDDATVRGRRLTVNLMAQPTVFSALVGIGDGLARGLGFLARFLLSWPTSTMGTPLYKPPPDVMPALDEFDRRIRALLEMPLPVEFGATDNALMPPLMQLSAPARAKWIDFFNATERAVAPGGDAAPVGDVASKIAEQAIRLAAVMTVVEQGVGDSISPEAMEAGCTIADWHLGEARRVLASVAVDPATADAIKIARLLVEENLETLNERELYQRRGFHLLRQADRRRLAFEVLEKAHYVRPKVGKTGGRSRDDWLVNPRLGAAQ